MSIYEWEKGEIKLPTAVFSKFRRELNEKYNKRQLDLFTKTADVYAKLVAEAKGKRGFKFQEEVKKYLYTWRDSGMCRSYTNRFPEADAVAEALFPGNDLENPLKRPQKKDFKLVKLTNAQIQLDDATITFVPERHSVIWSVPENNHACERAREDPIARVFFSMLDKVQWVRGTGGQIIGNDENNRDSRDSGGGANYTTSEFGPKVVKPVRFPYSVLR